jgi:hypothetical protein
MLYADGSVIHRRLGATTCKASGNTIWQVFGAAALIAYPASTLKIHIAVRHWVLSNNEQS